MAKAIKKAATRAKRVPTKKTAFQSVDAYLRSLEGPLAQILQAVRELMLTTDPSIGEQIKWNSPAFYYTGEMKPFDPKAYKRDIAVVNLYKKEYLLLIFPTGARIKDGTGLLEGNYPDGRRMVKVLDLQDLKVKEKALREVIKDWLKGVE